MKYHYFCGECGHRFDSDLPERDANGLHNDVWCPECGGYNVYPATPEGAAASVRDELVYQEELAAFDREDV